MYIYNIHIYTSHPYTHKHTSTHTHTHTGHEGLPPLNVVNATEEEVLSGLRQRRLQGHEAAELGHRLDLQHTGHDRPARLRLGFRV